MGDSHEEVGHVLVAIPEPEPVLPVPAYKPDPPKPKEVKPVGPQLKISFAKSTGAKKQDWVHLVVTTPGLGFSFHNQLPLVVNRVMDGKWAQQQGVQIGWTIMAI